MIAVGTVKKFGDLIRKAEEQTIEGIKEGRIETEPSITDRFLEAVENVFREHGSQRGIVFKTRTLRDRGRNASETRFGADFVGVLNVRLKGYEQIKGFLSQAKKEGNGIRIQRVPFSLTTASFRQDKEFERLKDQIGHMLSITPDSFVIVYGRNGFVAVPASSVNGLSVEDALYAKPIDRFFKEYLMCFIGDPRLRAWDDNSLEKLRLETKARTAIMFQIHESYIE